MVRLRRFPAIDRGVERFTYWWTFLGPGGVVWLIMSWAASHFPPIAQYGIGGVIFAGLGAACILMLVASISLIAWRYFHPLGVAQSASRLEKMSEPAVGSAPWKNDIENMAKLLEKYVDETTSTLITKNMPWRVEIARLNELGVSLHAADEDLRAKLARIQADLRNLDTKFHLFVTSVRARDALNEVLKPKDQIVMSLGKKLMYPESYSDARTWLADYQVWEAALKAIDDVVVAWTRAESSGYSSLFDLQRRHYEQAPMPPQNIWSDETIMAFKTVSHVQASYANQRDGIFSFFNARMIYPG